MNTQTHILISSALFARSGIGNRARNIAAISGGLVPDLPIFMMFIWSKITSTPEMVVWAEWYFTPPWLTWIDAANSFPVYWLLVMVGIFVVKWGGRYADAGVIIVIFSLSAMTHALGDFFLHVDDGHAHFWPLSDWRYISPVSYWDPRHHGQYFSVVEILLGLGLCALLFRRFKGKLVRAVLLLAVVAYIAVPAYFIFVLKHH